VRQYGRIFQYGTQQRSSRLFRHACELVRNQAVGEVERLEVWCPDASDDWGDFVVHRYGSTDPAPVPAGFNYDMWLGPAPDAPYTVDRCRREGSFHNYDYSIGFIAGWGAHPLDIAQWGMDADEGGPIHYEGTGSVPQDGLLCTVDTWDITCTYPNGVPMRFMNHRTAQPIVSKYRPWSGHGTTFFGSKGWISVDRGGMHVSDESLRNITFGPNDIRLYNSPEQYRNFLDCVKSRNETISPFEAAIRSDTISHLSELCVRTGRPITWNTKTEQAESNGLINRLLHRGMREPWRL
jgi:predicted dehydrogenase